MKKIPGWIIALVVIALLIGSKLLFFPKKNDKIAPGQKQKAGPVTVNYFVTRRSEISNDIFATGKIGAINQVEIVPEVSGKVAAISFREGELVNKGALLVKLNDADLQAQLLKVRTQLRLSQQKLDRLKKLLDINGISQEEYDMQENELMSLKADDAYISAQIAKTNIIAPFTGQAGLKNISEGSFVSSSTPIVSLVQMKPLYVEFSVPEKYASLFKKGNTINFSSEGLVESTTYSASIYAIDPLIDEATKSIRARAMYNGPADFYPGRFVKVKVDLGKSENVIMIPSQAVIGTLKGQKVFVSRDGVAAEVPVSIGVRSDQMIQITEGLNEGDTVITTGLMSLKKDTPLKLSKTTN